MSKSFKNIFLFSFLVIVITALSLTSCTAKKKTNYVTIGTGGVTGVYYPAGGAIAKMLNKKSAQYNVRASVESTGGSVYNINAIMAGDLEIGVAQSDRQYQAYNGTADWQDIGAQKDLRAVFSLHREAVTLVAAVDSGIRTLSDLKGKRVNIGNPGSGQRGNALDVLRTANIDYKKDLRAESLKAAEAAKFLQDSRIDAFFYTVGHPSAAITESTTGKRKVLFVPITGMDSLLSQYPYYAKTIVPVKVYPLAKSADNVDTIGVVATIVTSKKVSEDIIYALTKEVFDNLEEFKKLHPAFSLLTKKEMLQGMSAPMHRGAIKYFKEVGLL